MNIVQFIGFVIWPAALVALGFQEVFSWAAIIAVFSTVYLLRAISVMIMQTETSKEAKIAAVLALVMGPVWLKLSDRFCK